MVELEALSTETGSSERFFLSPDEPLFDPRGIFCLNTGSTGADTLDTPSALRGTDFLSSSGLWPLVEAWATVRTTSMKMR